MIWVGGGAGMAPLRAQIMHMLKTLKTTDREMHYFYGARAIDEVFFLDDFLELEKEFPNFHVPLASSTLRDSLLQLWAILTSSSMKLQKMLSTTSADLQ